jgi:hypothetical protein
MGEVDNGVLSSCLLYGGRAAEGGQLRGGRQ